jgi:hypothetical protein
MKRRLIRKGYEEDPPSPWKLIEFISNPCMENAYILSEVRVYGAAFTAEFVRHVDFHKLPQNQLAAWLLKIQIGPLKIRIGPVVAILLQVVAGDYIGPRNSGRFEAALVLRQDQSENAIMAFLKHQSTRSWPALAKLVMKDVIEERNRNTYCGNDISISPISDVCAALMLPLAVRLGVVEELFKLGDFSKVTHPAIIKYFNRYSAKYPIYSMLKRFPTIPNVAKTAILDAEAKRMVNDPRRINRIPDKKYIDPVWGLEAGEYAESIRTAIEIHLS